MTAAANTVAQQRQNTRLLLLGRLWFFVTGYAVMLVLTRVLVPDDFGSYVVFVSLVSWLAMATSFGVPSATSKLLADHLGQKADVERSAAVLLLFSAGVVFATCWVAAPRIAQFFHLPGGELLFRIAILDLPFQALLSTYHGILSGRRRFGLLAGIQASYGTLKLVGVLALLTVGVTLDRVLLATAGATALVCMGLAVRCPVRGRPSLATIRRLATMALPMGLYLVAGQVLVNLDLWSLKRLWAGGGDVIGHYAAALQLAKTLLIIPTVQSGVLLATVAWALAANDAAAAGRYVREAVRFAVILAAPACVLLGADSATVLATLFSRPYAAGAAFLELQLIGYTLFALLDAFAACLIAAGRQWLVAGALFGIVPIMLAANMLLIPRLGGVGAATGFVTGGTLGLLVLGFLARRRFGAILPLRTMARVAVASGAVGLLAVAIDVGPALLFPKLAALGVVYLGLLAAMGEINRSDFGLPRADPPTGAPAPRS